MIWWVQLLLYLIGIWGTLLVLDRVFHLRRFNIEVSPLTVLVKTRRINNFITRIGSKHRWFWKAFWTLGSAIGIVITGYAFYYMGTSFIGLFLDQPDATPVAPILPGINVRLSTLPFILIAMLVSLVVHELSHGIASVAERLPIKSAGVFLFILFPGAFVEVDDEQVKKRSPKTRMRILSAGIFSNLLTALVVLLLISVLPLMLAPFYSPEQSLLITEVEAGSPADGLFTPYTILQSINETEIKQYADFIQYMGTTRANQTVIVETSAGTIIVQLIANPSNASRGYLGLLTNNLAYTPRNESPFLSPLIPYAIFQSYFWTFLISISLGIINLLPLPLLDGDGFLKSFLEQYIPTRKIKLGSKEALVQNVIWKSARYFSILFFIGSILLTFVRFGTLPLF